MSKHPVRAWRERRALLARAALQAAGLAAERRGQGRLRDLRLGPQGRDAEPRADRAGDPGAAEDAPPRRQRRRRGRRLRPDARHPAQDLGRGGPLRRPRPLADPRRRLRRRPRLHRALPGPRARSSTTPASCSAEGGFRVLAERIGVVDSPALGPTAREEEPHFWQIAGLVPDAARRDRVLFELLIELEQQLDVHVPSFSATTCVYKVMGAPKVLGEYYPDLRDERFETIGCFGHNRYSTNTWPSFKRVQPFSVARPQRRDQHDRTAAPGGEDAGGPDPARLLGLPGPEPDDRHPGQPRGPQPRRGDGDGGAADRRGDPRACPRSCTASTCTCARRWGRSRRARWR